MNFSKMTFNVRLLMTAIALTAASSIAQAQTTLNPGDIQVLGVNSDANDAFSFVLWRAIEAGTVIRFMDHSFTSNNGTVINGTENDMALTFSSALSPGAVIRVEDGGPTLVGGSAFSGNKTGTLSGISNNGDQVFAYQGSAASGTDFSGRTLLYGFNIADTNWLTSGTADAQNSYLPTAISGTDLNFDSGNFDNADYAGTRTGMTVAAYRAAINSITNYTQNNTRFDLATGNFTIASSTTLHWDANGSAPGDGGSGIWDTTTQDRFKNAAAGTTFLRWVNSSAGNDHTAAFGGTAGNVTVATGGVTVSGLQFDTAGYVIGGNPVTLSGATATVNVATTGNATINSVLAGTSALNKTGPGELILGANNTFSGGTTVAGGNLTILGDGVLTRNASGATLVASANSTIKNEGAIRQTGSGRVLDVTTANLIISIINNGTISGVSSDAIRVNADSEISLTNSGNITVSAGGEAVDWAAISTKSNILINTGNISAVGADAVRPGQNGVVVNSGNITATPTGNATVSGSDGIDLRTQKTVFVTNNGTITGRHGIATDGANVGPSSLTVNNTAGGLIQALNGSGLNVDGVNTSVTANVTNAFGATIQGGVLASTTEGDGDGIDVDGVLTLVNSGNILGLGAKGGTNNAEGIAAGGGSITNTATGQIVGSSLAADAPNGDPTRAGNGILIDNSNGGDAVAATTVDNHGLIRGKTGFGIRFIGGFADTITNHATGTIRGNGGGAVIQTGGGNDLVTNRGLIQADSGPAIDLEAGDDTLVIEGGSAAVIGNISGGTGNNTMTIDPGASNSFSFADSISNFNTVNIISGTVTLSGVNTYTGSTNVTGGKLLVNGSLAAGSAVTVAAGATLGGSGSVGGTVNLFGILSPGTSIESLATGSNTWNSGAGMHVEFSTDGATGSAGSEWDLLAITGTLDLNSVSLLNPVVLSLATMANASTPGLLASWDPNSNHTWAGIVTTTGGILGFSAGKFVFDTSAFQNPLAIGSYFAVQQNGNQLDLLYVVPEPSTTTLIGLALLALLGRRRRS